MRISDWSSDVCSSDLQWHEAASAIHLAPDPVEGRQDRPPHRVVRPELKYGKQAWQHAPVMIGPGTTHHLVDAPVQSALRMALLDDRRQLGLTGDRENDIADAPRWFIDRGAGDLRSEEHTSELQSLIRISYAVFCLKKNTKYNRSSTPSQS